MPKPLNRTTVKTQKYPERILQFGEGNFLRGFIDWMVQKMNDRIDFNTGVVIIQPRSHNRVAKLNAQDGLYTVRLTGLRDGEKVVDYDLISCVTRGINPYLDFDRFMSIAENPELAMIVSNTTEAGIVFVNEDKLEDAPPSSFPGKLTRFLFARYSHFEGNPEKGLVILPCELIDNNGNALLRTVLEYVELWQLPEAFLSWLHEHCIFCNTLVDRIVPGFPENKIAEIYDELGYEDQLLVEGEHFHLLAIEAPDSVASVFPAPDADLNVVFTKNLEEYRLRKVRILNGSHTCMTPVGYLAGLQTVRESVEDTVVGRYIRDLIYDEIVPALDLEEESLRAFAEETIERFRNPWIKHHLTSIALYSISKYKTRIVPSMVTYYRKYDKLPGRMILALAALLRFYQGTVRGSEVPLDDHAHVILFVQEQWKEYHANQLTLDQLVQRILTKRDYWGGDLTELNGLSGQVTEYLNLLVMDDPAPSIRDLIHQLSQ